MSNRELVDHSFCSRLSVSAVWTKPTWTWIPVRFRRVPTPWSLRLQPIPWTKRKVTWRIVSVTIISLKRCFWFDNQLSLDKIWEGGEKNCIQETVGPTSVHKIGQKLHIKFVHFIHNYGRHLLQTLNPKFVVQSLKKQFKGTRTPND